MVVNAIACFLKLTSAVNLPQYALGEEWTVLCNTLASRLLGVGDRLAATLCYICAGNIDKTVETWSHNLKSHDGAMMYINRLQVLLKKGVPSAVGFPHCAGSGEGLSSGAS